MNVDEIVGYFASFHIINVDMSDPNRVRYSYTINKEDAFLEISDSITHRGMGDIIRLAGKVVIKGSILLSNNALVIDENAVVHVSGNVIAGRIDIQGNAEIVCTGSITAETIEISGKMITKNDERKTLINAHAIYIVTRKSSNISIITDALSIDTLIQNGFSSGDNIDINIKVRDLITVRNTFSISSNDNINIRTKRIAFVNIIDDEQILWRTTGTVIVDEYMVGSTKNTIVDTGILIANSITDIHTVSAVKLLVDTIHADNIAAVGLYAKHIDAKNISIKTMYHMTVWHLIDAIVDINKLESIGVSKMIYEQMLEMKNDPLIGETIEQILTITRNEEEMS